MVSGWESPATLTFAVAVLLFAEGPIFAVVPTLAMNASSSNTGAAAAFIVAAQMAIGSLAALGVTWVHDGTALPMMITMQALVVIVVLAYLDSRKRLVA